MSFDFSKLKEVFNETEHNLKLIEHQNSKFAVTVLNELRYVLRHAIDSDEAKAMAHLQRALFDSYDLLLIYQLDKIKEYEDEFGYYSDCVQLFISDYADWRIKANKAVRLHVEFVQSSDRTLYYRRMKDTTSLLESERRFAPMVSVP